jgi:hypothetical protein
MPSRKDEMSRADPDRKSSDIRRDTQVRGSMGKPASGRESDTGSQSSEDIRGRSTSESSHPPRQPGRLPLPD